MIEVGCVVKPHGIRGEVVVESWSDHADRFDADEVVTVDGLGERRVLASRPHQGRLLVAFDGVGDRNAAEGLRGRTLSAPPRDTADDEVFWADELVGLEVRLEDGTLVGTVTDLVEMPQVAGYDLLEVDRPDDPRPLLLPGSDELVAVVEAADGALHLELVDPPAGLLDVDDLPVGPDDAA